MKHFLLRRRPRRLRQSTVIRDLVQEHWLNPRQFMQPFFVTSGKGVAEPISSMPGICRYSVDKLSEQINILQEVGIESVLLFPVVPSDLKDKYGSLSQKSDFYFYEVIEILASKFPDLIIATDVALDPFTDHGHDGILENGKILNDETIPFLANMAIYQAKAGAKVIAPSDMMDGRIGYIRDFLDKKGFEDTLIMSYSAKYASSFYGPFRDALSSHTDGDKKTYQLNPSNTKEAVYEALLDFEEGADIILVKPGLAYLDIISAISQKVKAPLAAYSVSGEYAMMKAAANNGWIDYEKCILETFLSFNRAGADIIISYASYEVAKILKSNINSNLYNGQLKSSK